MLDVVLGAGFGWLYQLTLRWCRSLSAELLSAVLARSPGVEVGSSHLTTVFWRTTATESHQQGSPPTLDRGLVTSLRLPRLCVPTRVVGFFDFAHALRLWDSCCVLFRVQLGDPLGEIWLA